jgi:hypothetical protein
MWIRRKPEGMCVSTGRKDENDAKIFFKKFIMFG